jgi:hypothetical protein
MSTSTTSPAAERVAEIEAEIEKRSARIDDMIADALHQGRDLTDNEDALANRDKSAIDKLEAQLVELREQGHSDAARQRAIQLQAETDRMRGRVDTRSHSPLMVSETHLRSHADAIRTGSVFGTEEELSTRANVATTDMGSAGAWGSPVLRDPLTLRAFAGIPNSPLTGSTAQMPSLTLPAGAAGAAEGTAHGEYDAIDPVNLSTLRYGRWTQVTSFVDAFDDLTAINRAHAIGIARDLNLADGNAIQTAAGSVTAFSAADLDKNVRIAILKVAAAALVDPEEVVLFGTSTALGQINGYAPASGDDRGSVTTRVFGARVFVHEAATAGNVYAFAPAGFQVFSDRLRSASTIDPTNGMVKFGQWLHSTPAGVGVVGAAAGVDVLTP